MVNLFKNISTESTYRALKNYFHHPGIVLFRQRELSAMESYIDKNPIRLESHVLDLGCGEGYIGSLLFNKIDVGLDLFDKDIKIANKTSVYKHTVAADAREIPFKDDVFDIVFSNSVIEHIFGLERVLREISRILRNRGLLIFTVPSKKFSDYLYFTNIFEKLGLSFLGLDKIYSKLRNRQLNHFNLLDDLEWERKLNTVSLSLAYIRYYLSREEIYEWDKICILLRISKPLYFIQRFLEKKFYANIKLLLAKNQDTDSGACMLVVAKKMMLSS